MFLLPFFRCVFAFLALFPAALSAATQIHISPTGNDANPGTAALPVATPQGAQTRVRPLIQAGLTDAVEVIFATGTYVMDAPLELRPEDSGTAAFLITWKAATGAEVVLSGGRTIASTWTNDGGGIWHTDLAGIGLGANQWNFRQLFVNGSRATRARYPNVTASNPFLYATGGDFAYLTITPALVKAGWGTAADAQINIVPQSRFFNQWNTVTAVNTTTGRIDIADSERHRLIDSGSWFWIEGVQQELDEPGEWFLNPTTGRLYYMPQPGVDPNTLTIIAPFLNRIVNAKGDVNAGTHVANVNFDGLKFRHTTFTLGQIEARVHTDTAVMFENTHDSSVKNCDFENIGGYALWLHLDSQRNVFDRNTVLYAGGGGVLLTGSRFAYMDDTKIYTPGEAAAKVAPILNEITHNTVEHCGRIRYYGGGVHLDSRPFSMTMAPGNHIAHNHFNDLSRNGVFAFRNQGGNVVEYNHIHNAMQTTIDGAAIHFATMNTLNSPNFILNNWLYDIWGWKQQSNGTPVRTLGNGVFLDWDTSNTTVKDNWIYNSVSGAVKVIFGGNQNVVQSGNQSSSTVITPPFVAEVGPAGTATNGINMEANKFTGSIISYQDASCFARTGTWTEETATGIVNLFEFKFLTATAAVPSLATYTLPITEDGTYQISLLYKPAGNRASNVPIAIDHADGIANVTWNMQQGSTYGFAVPVGTYRFVASETNTVTLSTTGTNGKVIADSVGFVKIGSNYPPLASNVQVTGAAYDGGTLSGNYDYSDVNNDPQGTSQFKWVRSDDEVFDAGDAAISGATGQSYTAKFADRGKYLFFEVTPVASTGVSAGSPVRSPPVLISAAAGFIHKLANGIPQRIVLYGTSLTAGGAWVSQLQTGIQAAYPGPSTFINSGGSGKASDWGVTNLQTKVIDQNPDVVFIEFSMNDAALTLNISRAQALANLTTMVNGILTAKPGCEIILQLMNPPDIQPGDTLSPRTYLTLYQQDYHTFAALNGLLCIDHMPAFTALLDKGSAAYRVYVTDGVHPSADGWSRFMTPVLFHALGVGTQASVVPQMIIDNSDPSPAMVFNGSWTSSSATAGFHGTDYRHNGNTDRGLKSAVFTPTFPSSGTYPVYLRWTSESNRASNVPVSVNYNGGSQTVMVNQILTGGKWFKLGDFPFAAGTSGTVTVGTAGTDGYVIVDALGVGAGGTGLPEARLRMDNARAAEPAASGGSARNSSLIVWLPEPAVQPLEVFLNFAGGTATNGTDYAALPQSVTIPAGASSAQIEMTPLLDPSIEGDETFHVSILPNAGYVLGSPVEASIVIEDNAPPTLSGKNPAAGASNVPVAADLVATFSEPIQAGTGTITIKNLTDATQSTIDITAASQVVISGAVLTINPTANLLAGKQYAIQIAGTAIQDASGNLYGGIADNTTWSFTTLASTPAGPVPIVVEGFNGSSSALNGSSADTFATAITTAGGSATWVANSGFLQNGAVGSGATIAYLNLGTYLNHAKGTADGKFALTMTVSETAGNWISLGFAAENTPNILRNFTNTPVTGTGTTTGLATLIYRAQNSTSIPGELDMFGSTNQNAVDGPDANTGLRTLTVTLDLTPAGGYNGTSNFGTVTWSDSVLGTLGTFTYTTTKNFGAILISGATTTGTVNALTLGQFLAGSATDYVAWLAANPPASGFGTDSDNDGIPNGVEHIFGSNPNSPTTGLGAVSATASSLTFRHPLNPNIASDVTYSYQWSSDLAKWHASGGTNTGGTSATITPSSPDANRVVTVVIAITGGPATKLFGRVEAQVAP